MNFIIQSTSDLFILLLYSTLQYRMVSWNVRRKIVRQSTIATCSKRKRVAAKNVKVSANHMEYLKHYRISQNFYTCHFRSQLQSAFTMVRDMRAEQNGQIQTIHAPVINVLPALLPNQISNAIHRVIIHCYQDRASAVRPAWVSYQNFFKFIYSFSLIQVLNHSYDACWNAQNVYQVFRRQIFMHTSLTSSTIHLSTLHRKIIRKKNY